MFLEVGVDGDPNRAMVQAVGETRPACGRRTACASRRPPAVEGREIDEAAQVIGEAAVLAASCRSDRLSGIIAGARADLTPWADALCVRHLDDLMNDYGLSNSQM
ncbi:hypothetical protein ACLMAL_10295 [Nocardia sp. CWNU-33]|uniref:hypothetical protein n=1 Tax=Nocardia sp. CWNU-33 TaxID=3392117 RepID=UPI00398ED75C